MASVALVFRLVVCLTVLNHGPYFISTTAAFPAQETCHVSTVTEGESAVMTFKIRSGIDTASKTFYAHLRRNDCKLTDIVTCDGLKVACDVKDGHPMFQVDTITEHKLTVHISNMSRELEDTYVLQVFFNGIPEPVSSCTLNITYTQTITTIITDVKTEDQNDWNAVLITVAIIIIIIILVAVIVWVFFWERVKSVVQQCTGGQTMDTHDNTDAPDIESPGDPEQVELEEERTRLLSDDSTTLGNHTRVSLDPHRDGKPTDKEQLSRSQGQSPEKTRAGKPTNKEQLSRSQGQSPEKTRDGKPTDKEQLSRSQGQSPEKTSDTKDNKADKMEETSPEETRLTGGNKDTNKVLCGEQKEPHSREIAAVPVSKRSSDAEREGDRSSMPQPKTKDELDSHGYPRYYHGELSDVDEKRLLLSEKNGQGSFLIKDGKDTNRFILSVNWDENVLHYPFRRFGSTYKLDNNDFATMHDLTKYYQAHDINIFDGHNISRLKRPVEVATLNA